MKEITVTHVYFQSNETILKCSLPEFIYQTKYVLFFAFNDY